MAKKTRNGFWNDAADKIWTDHLGNNRFVEHRDQCTHCLAAFKANQAGQPFTPSCAEGERAFDAMLEEVDDKIFEVMQNQN
jgi:hypothetical protein